jgi:hypothetical protein
VCSAASIQYFTNRLDASSKLAADPLHRANADADGSQFAKPRSGSERLAEHSRLEHGVFRGRLAVNP